MRILVVDNDGKAVLRASLDECKPGEHKLLWVDLEGPPSQEIAQMRDRFRLHPVVFAQLGATIPVPKMQEFDDYLYIVWDFLRDRPETEHLEVEGLYLVLGRDYLVTAHRDGLEELDQLLERVRANPGKYDHPAALLYNILEPAVDEYFPRVDALTERIDEYTEELVSDTNVGDLSVILDLKHHNMAYRRAVYAHRDLLVKLSRRDIDLIPDQWDVYLIDIYDRMAKVAAEVEYNAEQVASALDIHMSAVSNRLNKTMKRLTAVATFFMPATFLVGLYGMNFESMPEFAWRYGYIFFWVVLLVATAVMVYIGKRQDWF
jgi:magnesium transporter